MDVWLEDNELIFQYKAPTGIPVKTRFSFTLDNDDELYIYDNGEQYALKKCGVIIDFGFPNLVNVLIMDKITNETTIGKRTKYFQMWYPDVKRSTVANLLTTKYPNAKHVGESIHNFLEGVPADPQVQDEDPMNGARRRKTRRRKTQKRKRY